MRLLLVEDNAELADVVRRGLVRAGMAVDCALDGRDALVKIGLTRYDVVVLDRDLPGVHGDDVCRAVVTLPEAPRVIMLTAAGAVSDRVDGLALGADDYLPKPFAMEELVARAWALSRRPTRAWPPVLEFADVRLDPTRHTAERAGRSLSLSRKEFGVLAELLAAEGQVLSAEDLLERVWDEHADPFTNAVRITMVTLRRKLGNPPLIETVTGVGYRVVDPKVGS